MSCMVISILGMESPPSGGMSSWQPAASLQPQKKIAAAHTLIRQMTDNDMTASSLPYTLNSTRSFILGTKL